MRPPTIVITGSRHPDGIANGVLQHGGSSMFFKNPAGVTVGQNSQRQRYAGAIAARDNAIRSTRCMLPPPLNPGAFRGGRSVLADCVIDVRQGDIGLNIELKTRGVAWAGRPKTIAYDNL